MSRFVPTAVVLLAVFGLLMQPTTVFHAHEGGHDEHSHDAVPTVHVAMPHAHSHGAGHDHRHPPAPQSPQDDDVPVSPDAPESHVHAIDGVDAIAHSSRDLTIEHGAGVGKDLSELASAWTVFVVEPRGPIPRTAVPPQVSSRSTDRLVRLGALLF